MAVTQLGASSIPLVTSRPLYRVEAKRVWSSAWQTVPYLEPVSVSQAIAPAVSQAVLRYRYGDVKREDWPDFDQFDPLQLANWYVRVIAIDESGAESVLFVGIAADETYQPFGDPVAPSGDQTIVAYGLEHLLDRIGMVGGFTDAGWVSWTPTFNQTEAWGKAGLRGNRSAVAGMPVFSVTDGAVWSHLDIIRYALQRYPPAFDVQLSGQYQVLDDLRGVYHFEGLSLKQIFDKLIDRRRGLGWRIVSDGITVALDVFTVFDQDMSLGATIMPENPRQITLNVDSAIDISNVQMTVAHAQLYDRIIVQGQRAKAQFTVSVADGTLTPGWDPAREADYAAANDKQRSTDEFDDVYQRYVIPDGWDWTVGGVSVVPSFDDNAVFAGVGGPAWTVARPLLRSLLDVDAKPIRVTVTITDKDGNSEQAQIDQLDKHGKHPGHVITLDDAAGFYVKPVINHILALNHFDPDTATETKYKPEVDYATLQATVAIETDVRPLVVIDLGGETDTTRTLILTVYDAEFWYDADNGVVLRDDTDKLRSVAALARGWYGQVRSAISMTVSNILISPSPGDLLLSVTSSWTSTPIGTVVSSVTYDCDNGTTTFDTGHSELDIAALIDVPGMSDLRSVGRAFNRQQAEIAKLSQRVGNLPARLTAGGARGGGGGGGVPAKVTAKIVPDGAGGYRTATSGESSDLYHVDLYEDGPDSPATEQNVVCRQLQIDKFDTIPSGTWTLASNIGGEWYMQVPVWL